MIKEVCLSTTEAEYSALSKALKDVKFLQQLMDESRCEMGWSVVDNKATVVQGRRV